MSARNAIIIRGNHDKVCSGVEAGEMSNKVALQSARWTEEKLLPRHRKWLAPLPKGPVQVNETLSLAHGTPLDEDVYISDEYRSAEHVPALRYSPLFLRSQPLPRFVRVG